MLLSPARRVAPSGIRQRGQDEASHIADGGIIKNLGSRRKFGPLMFEIATGTLWLCQNSY